MEPRGSWNHQRGRPAERQNFVPPGPAPYLQRRESSLSQDDENEVFEDARECWDPESPPATVDRTNTESWTGTSAQHTRMSNIGAQEERRPVRTYNEDKENTSYATAQPGWTTRRNLSVRTPAAVGRTNAPNLLSENHAHRRQPILNPDESRAVREPEKYQYYPQAITEQQPTRASPLTPSISITSSEGYSRGPEARSSSVAPSITPSVEDTSTRYDKECEVCKRHVREIWYCNVCKYSFCNGCWDTLFLHRAPPRKGRNETPHEKTDPTIAEKVHKVMSPPADDWAREQLYKDDEITSWFGIERPSDFGPPMFQDYGRFAELMASTDPIRMNPGNTFVENTRQLDRDNRTPSLVSFVGQTGAGKSTLVKLLINFSLQDAESYSSPVVGPPGAHLPTSEDVHLYMDPRTADSQGPVLYADCEGLEGGEREPLGAKFRKKRQKDVDHKEKALKSSKIISERELRWANGPLERSREFAVTNLYPRLLYTFSDVIVFVLRNPRQVLECFFSTLEVVEHVFERLITWAAAAIETSSNQPVLPHAIIVLNASENDLDEKLWDVPTNTESILEDLGRTVNRNETFKKWAQFWRERGKEINTLTELVLCYYSSVQILRIPQDGRPKLMQEQVEKLYNGTLTACIAARCARNRLRMLLDVDDLQAYLQEAFSHYTSTLDSPFDFVQASFRNSPIPPDFGGNILKLALNVMDILQVRSNSITDGRRIFAELAYVVASCIMLDNARHKTKGNALKIFENYMNHLDDALENFCDHHWPCEFVNPKRQRCVNVRVGHQSKGHQSKDGKVFAAGDYVSSFSFNAYYKDFRNTVYSCLVALLDELAPRVQEGTAEEAAAAAIHKEMVITNFFAHITTASHNLSVNEGLLHSHSACFCCLFGQAEVQLPCGHIICTPCLTTYGKPNGEAGYEIDGCPIEGHVGFRQSTWRIQLKPKLAGVRIMTLDGGGIRGIVELEVLRHIEMALGDLPIQCFFDLIVGTRYPIQISLGTGGLVALGLTTMNWSVEECIENFEKLCDQAFTRRSGGSLPIIGAIVENYHHSKYQTATLDDALKTAFPKDLHLFGGRRPAELCASSVKVAVTATSLAGNKTYILSNYNRPEPNRGLSSYHFQRPERIDNELKIWEAARATSAAPRFFKSFHHEMSQKTYIDGAIHHNNPCRVADSERKALWPEIDAPDVFLSLGTGASISLERQTSERMSAAKKGIVSHGMTLFNILKKNMETALNCDRIWEDYFASVATKLQPGTTTSRYHRINPRLEGEVPALDDKDKMGQVRRSARAALVKDHAVERIARQLLASSFYFQLGSISDEQDGLHFVQGKIMCRLPQPSPMVRKLGKHLHQEMIEHGELSFVVWEQSGAGPQNLQRMDRQPLSQRVIEKMVREHRFEMERFVFQIRDKVLPTHINLCFGNMTMVPISGFPRSLLLTSADNNHNSSPRSSTSALPLTMFQNGPGGVTRAASRYTHGSRRLKRGAAWEPPSLQDFRSIPDLRQYGDPDRAIGSDVVEQQQAEAATGADHGSTLPEVVVPDVKSRPVPTKRPTVTATAAQRQQQKPQEQKLQPQDQQPSTRTTLRNAFRALLWPIRAHPAKTDDVLFPDEGSAEEAMSQFVSTGSNTKISPYQDYLGYYSQSASAGEHEGAAPPSPGAGPLTMQYYHVDSAENEIYQQWVNLLGPSMGGAWVPLNQSQNQPGHGRGYGYSGLSSPPWRQPAVPELSGRSLPAELPSDSVQPVELQG